MSLHNFARFDVNGRISFEDGSPTPLTNSGDYAEGDTNVSDLGRRLNELVPVFVRGQLVSANYGERKVPQITLSEVITNMIATAAPGPIRDMLTGTGAYANAIGTMGENRPYTVHTMLTVKGLLFGSVDEVLKFEHVHWGYGFTEGRPNKHAWTGMILGRVLINGVVVSREIDSNGT